MKRPKLFTSFSRSQLASLIATAVDFSVLVGLVELFGVWYVTATAVGAFCGAITHFLFGRYWSFMATQGNFWGQAFRYAVAALGSLGLNSGGVYFFTDYCGLPYALSKIIVAILIGILFNFPMHQYYVFR